LEVVKRIPLSLGPIT